MFKDYYKILNLNSTATQNEIKKSYRKLALKFHPDKNFGSTDSEIKFREINEAYNILNEAQSRTNYDYEYNGYYKTKYEETKAQETQSNKKAAPVTPEVYLKIFSEMRLSLEVAQAGQVNRERLYNKLNELLNNTSISFLVDSDHFKTNRQIIIQVLRCCAYLSFNHVEIITAKLARVAGSDNEAIEKINSYNKRRRIFNYWPKYRGVALVVVLIIFVIITNYQNEHNSTTSDTTGKSEINQPQSGNLYNNGADEKTSVKLSVM